MFLLCNLLQNFACMKFGIELVLVFRIGSLFPCVTEVLTDTNKIYALSEHLLREAVVRIVIPMLPLHQ